MPGQTTEEIPIHDSTDAVCAVLRANAHEKMGDVTTAAALLMEMMQAGGPVARKIIDSVISIYPDWNLCEAAFPVAKEEYLAKASDQAGKAASGGIHVVLVPLGALLLAGGFVSLILCIAKVMPWAAAPGMLLGLGLTGIILFGLGWSMRKAAQKAAYLRTHGLPGMGTIESIQTTGTEINNVPVVEILLKIQLEDKRPAYKAKAKLLLSMVGDAGPGATVAVRANPDDVNEVIIETS